MFTWDMLGASIILLYFVMTTTGRWQPRAGIALLTTSLGSAIMALVGISRDVPGMVLLNGVWILVAGWALIVELGLNELFQTRENLITQIEKQDLAYNERLRVMGLDKGE